MTVDHYHLVTGEYPPQPGGVADYTSLLASGLAAAGVDIHVWASAGPEDGTTVDGITVHRDGGRWSPPDLRRLDAALDAFDAPRKILVQYAPNAWGYKGMNLGFCRWLAGRKARGDEVRVMFHEVRYSLEPWDKPARWLLVAVQYLMARTLVGACKGVYISIPFWEKVLRRVEPSGRRPIAWLPVPSNIGVIDDPAAVAEVRRRYAPQGQEIVGSFGTFGGTIGPMLEQTLPRILAQRDGRVVLLLGRGSERFATSFVAAHPELAGRVVASGGLSPSSTSAHLQACDIMIQPYPDGLTSRRGSLMAALAHGRPIVSNEGRYSETIWVDERCVALAPGPDPEILAGLVVSLLDQPELRAEIGEAALATYRRYFAIERTVEAVLRDAAPSTAPVAPH